MSDEIMKVLPPRTVGPTQGCLQMNVKAIRWFIDSPGNVTVGMSWWGDSSKCLFFPSENPEAMQNKKNRSYVFNIRSSKEQFLIYLNYHKRLKFFVWKHKNYIGSGVLENLSQLYEDRHFDDFIEIYNGNSKIIADLHVCFNLTFFSVNAPRTSILRTESVDNDTHPRSALSCYSRTGLNGDKFLVQSDLEPRVPVFSRLDPSEELFNLLRKERNNPSKLDVSEFWTDESDIERVPSTPSSEFSVNNMKNFDSKSLTQQLLNYLKGVNMTEEDQKTAIEILKNISPSSSLVNIAEPGAISEVDEDQLPRKGLPPHHLVSMPRVRSTKTPCAERKSLIRSHSASKLPASVCKNANSASPLKNQSGERHPSESDAGDQTKMKFYRIALDRIIFNSDGLRKLYGSGTIKGHQENNCPRANYIIQYKVSKVDPKFPLEKAEPIRHVSKKILANGVIFGENDVYKMKDLRSNDVITSFKISCQYLNQRLPVFLGETESLVVKESSKNSLYIKSLNGLTIGKLDVQIDVADCVKNLPPPETFSGRCQEDVEELIARSSLEKLKVKTNNSKYLELKAQLRNLSSNENLKNVPSAQYSTYLDSHVMSSRNLSDSAFAQDTDSTNNFSPPTEHTSDFLSDATETSHSSSRKLCSDKSHSDLVNSKDNARATDKNGQRRKKTFTSESSNDNTVTAAPQKYAVVTHEFYVKVNQLANCGTSVVNYVFPEGTAVETGEVVLKWPATSIFTNLSRPFFISLPFGITLKKFLKHCGKKSISFYFKQPNQKKTIAKAVLDLEKISTLEETYKPSTNKSPVSKIFSLPLELNNDLSCTYAEINIEYCNRICKVGSAQMQEQSLFNNETLKERSNLRAEKNISSSRCNATNMSPDGTKFSNVDTNPEKAEADNNRRAEDSSSSHVLNTTFSISENNITQEAKYQRNADDNGEKSVAKLNNEPSFFQGWQEVSEDHYSINDHLSTIIEGSELSKTNTSSNMFDCPVTSLSNDNSANLSQNFSNLSFRNSDQSLIQKCPSGKTEVLFENSKPAISTSSHLNSPNSKHLDKPSGLKPFCNAESPNNNEDDSDDCFVEFEMLNPEIESKRKLQANHTSTNCTNNVVNVQKLLPGQGVNEGQVNYSDPTLKAGLMNSDNLKLDQEGIVSSSNSATKGGEIFDSCDSPKWSTFNVGPVPSDHENDAVPKYLSPLNSARAVANSFAENNVAADENEISINKTGIESNRTASNDTVVTENTNSYRRNSDSGYVGSSLKDPFEQSISSSSKSRSEPNVSKKPSIVPLIDDFGVPAKRVSQEKSFLARIGIVRSINLPTIKLKGGDKRLTKPSTYVTFKDSFNRLNYSGTVTETLIPEYDSRHKAWLPTELLKNTEERLVFQVWCKRYQNEWAGPDCDRDRCLGYVFCNLSVLVYDFPYAGGWHNIVSLSGQINGQIQILVKPLQDISFVKNLECEELFHTHSNLMNYLQPHNYFSSSVCSNINDGITAKQLLCKNISELEEAIRNLQISHKNRQLKSEACSNNEDQHNKLSNDIATGCDFKFTEAETLAKEDTKGCDLKDTDTETLANQLNSLHLRQSTDSLQNSAQSRSKGATKKMFKKYFPSFRKKSKKNKKHLLVENESEITLVSNNITKAPDSNYKEEKREAEKDLHKINGAQKITQIENEQLHNLDDNESKNCKKSPSVFPRSFSFKLKKSENKNKTYQNALLQSLPLYEKNIEKKTEKSEQSKNCSTPNRNNYYISKANTLYHSL